MPVSEEAIFMLWPETGLDCDSEAEHRHPWDSSISCGSAVCNGGWGEGSACTANVTASYGQGGCFVYV